MSSVTLDHLQQHVRMEVQRHLEGPRHNLPWVALGGIALITACDILARVVNAPFEVPVSLILAMVGSVVFIALLLRQRHRA